MKTKAFWLVALLAAGVLTLSGCGNKPDPIENPDENAEIANPASVYCEENGWTLQLEEGAWLCMFADGSYCEEWAFMNGECQQGEIIYNTIPEDEIPEPTVTGSEVYSEEDLTAAEAAIMNEVNGWNVKVEMKEISYLWDERANSELDYCKSLNPGITECVIFTSNFYIPAQDAEMAGAFEPDSNINGWIWYIGKNAAGEWEVLTNGFG